jgi:uncharacterized protein with LGFP repeats
MKRMVQLKKTIPLPIALAMLYPCGINRESARGRSALVAIVVLFTLSAAVLVPTSNAASVYGAIGDKYRILGGPGGVLGPVLTDEADAPYGGRFNNFQNGAIFWHPSIGAFAVMGAISGKWNELNRVAYGYPITDESKTPDGIGRFNHFRTLQLNGKPEASIYWTPETGAHAIQGAIRGKWSQLGWETGLGYPITDELTTPDRRGRYNHFRSLRLNGKPEASIYWTPETGAHAVYGAIRAKWASLGWERSALGYPTSDEYQDGGYRRTDFEGGYMRWTARGGVEVMQYGSGVTKPGGFGDITINGLEVAVKGRVVAGDGTFLSEPAICGFWKQNVASVEQTLKELVRSTVNADPRMRGFSIRSDAQMTLARACGAKAAVLRACDNHITLQIALPRNLFKFHVTTPSVIGGWADPEFSIDWDMEGRIDIQTPTSPSSPIGVSAIRFTVSNIKPDSQNVSGDVLKAVTLVYSAITGNDLLAKVSQDRTFSFPGVQRSVVGLNPALKQIPANYHIDSCVNGKVLRLNATDEVSKEPVVR